MSSSNIIRIFHIYYILSMLRRLTDIGSISEACWESSWLMYAQELKDLQREV